MPHRTLDELMLLHELEPDLKEVLTEGRVDASIVAWLLESLGLRTSVYALSDRLYVDDELVQQSGLPVGVRGRMIVAARIVEQNDMARAGITFIVDADYDHAFGLTTTSEVECLLVTDYSSIETYCFDPKVLNKYLRVTLRAPEEIRAQQVLDAIFKGLRDLFLIRWLLINSPGTPKLIEKFIRRCKVVAGGVEVDVPAILRDSVQSADSIEAASIDVGELARLHDELSASLDGDPRCLVHGHDFSKILCLYLTKAFPQLFTLDRRGFKDPDVTRNTLLTCLEPSHLATTPMFKALQERAV